MNGIRATIHNGNIVAEEPVDFPEGTQLLVVPLDATDGDPEKNWDNSPEGIAEWLRWYDSLEPFLLTDAEQAEIERAKRERKEWELAHADERVEKLRSLWE